MQGRPQRLSQNFICHLNSTIDEVSGYFQIVQMHKKQKKIYSTQMSDGFFKCKVIVKEKAYKQIEIGQIKLFSVLYGKIENRGNRIFMVKQKLECWDYHKVIGLIKPWKHQRPNLNLQGSNLIRWSDTIDDQPDPQPILNYDDHDNKCDRIQRKLNYESNTVSLTNSGRLQQALQQNRDRDQQNRNEHTIISNGQTQSIQIPNNKNKEGQQTYGQTQSIQIPNKNKKDRIQRQNIIQQDDDFFIGLINKTGTQEQQKTYHNKQQQNIKSSSFQGTKPTTSNKTKSQKIEVNVKVTKKLMICQQEQLDVESNVKINQEIKTSDGNSNTNKNIKQQIINKQKQEEQEEQDSQEQLYSIIQQIKKQSQINSRSISNNNLQPIPKQQQSQDDQDQLMQVLKQIRQRQKPISNNINHDSSSQLQSEQQLRQILSEFHNQQQHFKSKQQQQSNKQCQQIDVDDLVPFAKYPSSTICIKIVRYKKYVEKNKEILLLIIRTKSHHIINFYVSMQNAREIPSQIRIGSWYTLSLSNITIIQPKQPQYLNHISLQTSLKPKISLQPNPCLPASNHPYIQLHQIQKQAVGTIINISGIIKSTFKHNLKTKLLIKLTILDIKTQASIQYVIFAEDSCNIFGDQLTKIDVQSLQRLVNQPILVYNVKMTSYQGRISVQHRNSTCVVIKQKEIMRCGEGTPKIMEILKWISENNHVDQILNDQHKYQPVYFVGDLANLSHNSSSCMFHVLKCKLITISPFYFYEGCPKCSKKLQIRQSMDGPTRVCYTCGIVPQDEFIVRYYISGAIGDVSGSIKVVWGHSECRSIFTGTDQSTNNKHFDTFKQKYLLNDCQVWLKLNNPEDKTKIISAKVFSAMKIKLLQKQKLIEDNINFIKEYLYYNR